MDLKDSNWMEEGYVFSWDTWTRGGADSQCWKDLPKQWKMFL